MTDVDSNDCNGECCHENGNVEVRTPVLYDDSGGREVVGKDNRVFEEIVPSCGIPVGTWCQPSLNV